MFTRFAVNTTAAVVIAAAIAGCGTPTVDVGAGAATEVRNVHAETARLQGQADWYRFVADDRSEAFRSELRVASDLLRARNAGAVDEAQEIDRFRQHVLSDQLRQ